MEQIHGSLLTLPAYVLALKAILAIVALGYFGAPLWLWTAVFLAALVGVGAPVPAIIAVVVIAVPFNVMPLRRVLISGPVMKILNAMQLLPSISETEQIALDAGTTWVDSEFFSGKPNFRRILDEQYGSLSTEEQAFIDGPVDELCAMVNDFEARNRRDLPPEAWAFLKEHRFFGMIIPKSYGGLEFSALAHSAVIQKLASRSVPLAVTTMVPNSLGPAELLLHYGTDEQKEYYLPRLARGEEIPCFALTEPSAGSDAGSISSGGEIVKGEDGELYVKLNWRKRYITLAAISTVLGLAFKLRDPNNLLGKGADLGITCALIPTDMDGVQLGRRHDPLGVPFFNCPTEGHDVMLPVKQIIGGVEGAGNGWRMLMECLAAGRSISLPALSTGNAKLVSEVTGAYTTVRKQFGLPIGRFEGIEEPMAEIAGVTYLLDAARVYTAGAVDSGAKPSVVSAIAKYNFTELSRTLINHGMDILGGAGISRGPKNFFANAYIATPISITVEGANILTRSMIVFGQGVIRCHPFARKEVDALVGNDLVAFDQAFWAHVGFVVRNAFRAGVLSVTRGMFASAPVSGPTAKYYRKMAWASATFAFMADVALGSYGGQLKRKEKITGRFADVLSWLYLASATLRRYEAEGRRREDLLTVHWAMHYCFSNMQAAFDGIYRNIRVPGASWLFNGPVAMWSRMNTLSWQPSDRLGAKLARGLQADQKARHRLAAGIYLPTNPSEPLGQLEQAFELSVAADGIVKTIKDAVRRKELPKQRPELLLNAALEKGLITSEQAEQLKAAEAAREEAIRVDAFKLETYLEHGVETAASSKKPSAVAAPKAAAVDAPDAVAAS